MQVENPMNKSILSRMFSAYGDAEEDKEFDVKIDAFRDTVKVSHTKSNVSPLN